MHEQRYDLAREFGSATVAELDHDDVDGPGEPEEEDDSDFEDEDDFEDGDEADDGDDEDDEEFEDEEGDEIQD